MDASYIPVAKARGFTTHWINNNAEKLYQKVLLIGLFLYPELNSNKERKRCLLVVMHIFCTFVGKSGWLVMIHSLIRFQFIFIHRS